VKCDNCGGEVDRPYSLGRFQWRQVAVCAACLAKITRGVAQVERAVLRRHAA
jgi:hypothetical protein